MRLICCSLVHKTKSRFQVGRSRFQAGLSRFQAGWYRFQAGLSRFPAGRKIIKVALRAKLKPTAAWDLKPKSKPCLGRQFLKTKRKDTLEPREIITQPRIKPKCFKYSLKAKTEIQRQKNPSPSIPFICLSITNLQCDYF